MNFTEKVEPQFTPSLKPTDHSLVSNVFNDWAPEELEELCFILYCTLTCFPKEVSTLRRK